MQLLHDVLKNAPPKPSIKFPQYCKVLKVVNAGAMKVTISHHTPRTKQRLKRSVRALSSVSYSSRNKETTEHADSTLIAWQLIKTLTQILQIQRLGHTAVPQFLCNPMCGTLLAALLEKWMACLIWHQSSSNQICPRKDRSPQSVRIAQRPSPRRSVQLHLGPAESGCLTRVTDGTLEFEQHIPHSFAAHE